VRAGQVRVRQDSRRISKFSAGSRDARRDSRGVYRVTFWENDTPEMQNPPERRAVRKSDDLGGLQISRNR